MLTALTFCVLMAATAPDPNLVLPSDCDPNVIEAIRKRQAWEEYKMGWVWKAAAILTLIHIISYLLAGKPVQAIMGAFPVFIFAVIAFYVILML